MFKNLLHISQTQMCNYFPHCGNCMPLCDGTLELPCQETIFIYPPLESGLCSITFLANGIFANVIQAEPWKELAHWDLFSFGCHEVNVLLPDGGDMWFSWQLASALDGHASEAVLDPLLPLPPAPRETSSTGQGNLTQITDLKIGEQIKCCFKPLGFGWFITHQSIIDTRPVFPPVLD